MVYVCEIGRSSVEPKIVVNCLVTIAFVGIIKSRGLLAITLSIMRKELDSCVK